LAGRLFRRYKNFEDTYYLILQDLGDKSNPYSVNLTSSNNLSLEHNINLSSFSFYLEEITRSVDNYLTDDLQEEETRKIENMNETVNKLLLNFVNVDDINYDTESSKLFFPNVSVREVVEERGDQFSDNIHKYLEVEAEIVK
jgi:hypothetical protein